MSEFKHKSIQKVYELYQRHNAEMGKGIDLMTLMWRSLSPSVPEMLRALDENEEMLGKIKTFLENLTEAMKEDAT